MAIDLNLYTFSLSIVALMREDEIDKKEKGSHDLRQITHAQKHIIIIIFIGS
jgi:hypothetical protein